MAFGTLKGQHGSHISGLTLQRPARTGLGTETPIGVTHGDLGIAREMRLRQDR